MNGAGLLVDTLVRAGVRRIFSLSGNQIMPVYDACIDVDLSIVHVRHESAAVHMADAWAQITGEIGVALVTAGPGFANALSALFSARHSESPVLLLSGDSPVAADGAGAFQEMPQIDLVRPLVKTARRPSRAGRIGHDVAAAIACARSGRPGPVHVALPFDVLGTPAGEGCLVRAAELARRPRALPGPVADDVAGRLARAKRPIVLTGPSLNRSRAGARIAAIETALHVPVVAMESPRGLRDPALGTFADVLAASDLVVLLGKAVDFSVGFARPPALDPAAELVVIDPDHRMIDRAYRIAGRRVVVSACADPDFAADALVSAVPAIVAAGSGASDPAWCAEVADAIANRSVAVEAGAVGTVAGAAVAAAAAAEAGAADSGVVEPAAAKAGIVEPAVAEADVVEPAATEAGIVEPAVAEADVVEPAAAEAGAVESATVESATVESATVESATVESATVESATVRPGAVESATAKPGAIESNAVEPAARFHPRLLCEAVQRVLDAADEAILICDGGEFGQWAQASCTAPVRIVNGLSGAIGGGLCHALAAKLARPRATVIAMMGDGTAGFHLAELDTAVREGAAFVTVVGNDFRWNAEHRIQLRDYGPDRLIGCDLAPTARYDLAAAGLGCHGEHVTDPSGLDAALARALACGRPACLNVEIDGVAAPVFFRGAVSAGH